MNEDARIAYIQARMQSTAETMDRRRQELMRERPDLFPEEQEPESAWMIGQAMVAKAALSQPRSRTVSVEEFLRELRSRP